MPNQREIDDALRSLCDKVKIPSCIPVEVLYVNWYVSAYVHKITPLGDDLQFSLTLHFDPNEIAIGCEAKHYKYSESLLVKMSRGAIIIHNGQCMSARWLENGSFHIRIHPDTMYR